MSFRKYGGTNKLEKNNNITVHSIVADTFTIRDAFLSIFTIEGDLRIGGNGFITDTLTVNQQINATTLDISSNVTIDGILYLDKTHDVFLKGSNKMIGINKSTPTATLDISSNQVQAFNLKTSAANNRNIIARNFPNNGIAVTATGTTESGIQFYSANTGTIDVSNAQGAMIKYSNTDSLLSIDSTGDVKVTSKMIITDNPSNGNTHTAFGETVLIYDKDNGGSQPVFFNEAYGNTTVKTGSAVTVQSINNASNTFMNIVTPNRLGIQIGGGSYPKDPTRSMGVIDIYNPSIDTDATPSMVIVSGNSVTKFNSTTGFNTFQPKYNNYAVDINGPLHLNNGEVKKTIETTSRITELYNFGSSYGIAMGGQGTEENNSYYPYTTFDGGKSWTRKNPLTSTDINSEIIGVQTFNSVYSYSNTRTIIGGTGSYAWLTDNGGINWYQLLILGINTINAIYTPLDISKNFVYTGGDAGGGNAIIRYGYIESFTHVYTGLAGNPTATRYRYTDLSYNYPITGGVVSDFAGYGQNFLVVGDNKIRKFDLGGSKMTLTLISTYTNPGNVTYSAVRMADANNGVAVGGNVISYTKDGGTNWTTANISPSLAGKTFNDVFLDSSMNAIVVGNNGYIYSSNDGYYTWKIVDEDVLNASGIGSRIIDSTNDITSVFMPDSSTIILSIVKNNNSNAKLAKLYYLNMPNIFNNKQNFLFDVSGCIRMSGDLVISDGGEIKSTNSTFNLLTTNIATLNAATNALNINMGGTNTTNISIGGDNTVNLLAGGNGTNSKIGPLNISPLVNGNVILANNLRTGNVFPDNIVISNNLQVTNGIATIANTLNSISATSGALQIYGGMGIQKDLHTSGNINTSGNLFVSGNNIQMVSSDDVLFTNVTINTYNYVPDTGPLRIKGGAAISKNMYVGNDLRVEGNIILKGTVTSFSGLSQTTTIDAVLILTPFHGNSTQDVDYLSLAQGALTTDGGFGVGKNTWLRGNLRVDGVDGVNINAELESTSTNSGALRIIGGVGIGGNTYHGGNVIINSNIEAINTSTGALKIRGGVGIGGNVYTGGNVIVNSTIESVNASTGALQIKGGVGIGGNVYTGGNVIVNSNIEAINSSTGALQIRGGVGIGGNIYTGGNVIVNSNIEAINTATGALQIRGGVAIVGNTYQGGNVIVNSNIEAINASTGALQIRGGVGIGGNVYTGGNVIVNSSIEAINTATGALQIRGGVAIVGNTYQGGNVIVNSAIESINASTGALQIRGGVGIGGNVYTGGNVIVNSNIEAINTATGALQIRGGVAIVGNTYQGGNVIVNSNIEAINASTGALQIRGGVGIGGNVYTGGNVIVNSVIESNSTITGALQIRGGVGIGRNLYTGGNVVINSTTESTTTTTGALQVLGGVGIGGSVNIGGNVFINKTTIVLDTTDSASVSSGAFQVRGGMGVANKIVSSSLATGQISATNLNLTSSNVSENVNSGALIITGGIGVGGSINTGGNIIINSIVESTSTNTGALQVRGGIGINGNVYSKVLYTTSVYTTDLNASGQMILSSPNESSNQGSGAVVIEGGLGVAKNINTGGNVIVYSIVESTSTVTGALRVLGGVGIAKNLNVGGGTTLGGLLNVTGSSTLSNTTIIGSLNVTGGSFRVTGSSTLSNTTIIGSLNVTGGPLTVGGGTTLGGLLNVTGSSRLTDTTIISSIDGILVAVGQGGNTIATSTNGGITWTGQRGPFTDQGQGVAWNGSLWVAVGGNSGITLATSTDGTIWIGRTSPFTISGQGVAWSPSLGLWVAVGSGGNTIATSTDGTTWVGRTSPFTISGQAVAWSPSLSLWVATGQGGNAIAYSNNGTTWTGLGTTIFSTAGYGVAWNGSLWVATGQGGNTIATSSNGTAWSGVTVNSPFSTAGYGVAWSQSLSLWVAVGQGGNTIATSSNGTEWSGVTVNSPFNRFGDGVAWNGSLWVAVGQGGNTIATSPNGTSWTGLGTTIFRNIGYGVAAGGGGGALTVTVPSRLSNTTISGSLELRQYPVERFLVATGASGTGGNQIATSSDGGLSWTSRGNITDTVNKVEWNGSLWVAVGTNGLTTVSAITSLDGINWISRTTPGMSTGQGVAWSQSLGLWVVVGFGTGNTIATSSDGITWTGRGKTIFSYSGYGVAWNGSLFVAVGEGTNTIATSENGTSWTPRTNTTSPTAVRGLSVSWNSSLWVVSGENSSGLSFMTTSPPDGTTWTPRTSPFTSGPVKAAWSAPLALWVAVGDGSNGGSTNTMATSTNGTSWTGTGKTVFGSKGSDIIWTGSQFVAVGGSANTIVTSTDGVTWTKRAGNEIFSIGSGVAARSSTIINYSDAALTVTGPSILSNTTINGSLNVIAERGRGLFVAVGGVDTTGNSIATSTDGGFTWTGLGKTVFSSAGLDIVWNGSLFMALGGGGGNSGNATIVTSSDGFTWTTRSTAGTTFYSLGCAVVWSESLSLWVVVGGTGVGNTIATSSDGITWTGRATTNLWITGFAVAWNGSLFVGLGASGGLGTGNSIATSTDGITWTARGRSIFGEGYDVAWNGSFWVAVGGSGSFSIATSTDGIAWTGRGTGILSSASGVAWSSSLSLWVVVGGTGGGNSIATSTDGNTWVGQGENIFNFGQTVIWNGTIFVAGGGAYIPGGNTIATSPDGFNWTVRADRYLFNMGPENFAYGDILTSYKSTFTVTVPSILSDTTINSLVVAETTKLSDTTITGSLNLVEGSLQVSGLWVAVSSSGGNTMSISRDGGISWTGLGTTLFSYSGFNVAWNGSLWVAVGSGNSTGNTIAYSSNGTNWVGLGTTIFTNAGRGIAWNGSYWVALGNGPFTIATSPDGITWTGRATTNLWVSGYGAAWSPSLGLWVAVGIGGSTIAYSKDGITWTGLGTSIFTNSGYGVAWNGLTWVATGQGGNTIASSLDGIIWFPRNTGNVPFSTSGSAVAWNGSLFVAAGSGGNTVATSSNGISWTGRGMTVLTASGSAVAWNGSLFIAVGLGAANSIATSSDGIHWSGRGGLIFTNGAGVAGTPNDTTLAGLVTITGPTLINSNVTSVSATTGSLRILGGLGVTGNIFAGGNCYAPAWLTTSDRRVKTDITDLNFSSLEIMRKIRPREYTMIDGSNESVYGFIAQEVKEIIPKSINLRKGYIPSIYENAFVDGTTITLLNKSTTDISCCKLKLRDQNNEDIIVSVTSIHDNKTFSINTDITRSTSCMDICGTILDKYIQNGVTTYMRGSQIYAGEVKQGIFVYGNQVDDFHSINKDTIWTITLSATQEMDSQLQEARRTIRTLEERVSAIEKRLS